MGICLYLWEDTGGPVSTWCDLSTIVLVHKVPKYTVRSSIFLSSNLQVPPASLTLAKPSKFVNPHLLGLDPGLPGHSGAVLQCRQSGGQEVDGDEAGEY